MSEVKKNKVDLKIVGQIYRNNVGFWFKNKLLPNRKILKTIVFLEGYFLVKSPLYYLQISGKASSANWLKSVLFFNHCFDKIKQAVNC